MRRYAYAIGHHFERRSVVIGLNELAITAMERAWGLPLPDEILPEASGRACS